LGKKRDGDPSPAILLRGRKVGQHTEGEKIFKPGLLCREGVCPDRKHSLGWKEGNVVTTRRERRGKDVGKGQILNRRGYLARRKGERKRKGGVTRAAGLFLGKGPKLGKRATVRGPGRKFLKIKKRARG